MLKILCISWNLQFCMLQLTMMYLQSFLVFAQLIILFGIVLSAAAPAEARQRHIENVLCDFCGKSSPNSQAYEQHRTCTKLKGSLKNRLLLASYAQSGAIGNPSWYHGNGHAFSKSFTRPQRFLRLDSKISEISTWPAYFHEISTWVPNFAFFEKNGKYDEHPDRQTYAYVTYFANHTYYAYFAHIFYLLNSMILVASKD